MGGIEWFPRADDAKQVRAHRRGDVWNRLRHMIDNFFSSQRPLFSLSKQVWNPPTDIYESGEVTKIKMEVAGLDERELEITVQVDMLVVRGRRAPDRPAWRLR